MMFFGRLEAFISRRYDVLRAREGFVTFISAFSILGIMIGVATLIIALSVTRGYETELLEKILGMDGHISVYAVQEPFDTYKVTKETLETLPGISHVAPVIEGQVMASSQGVSRGVMVRGMNAEDLQKRRLFTGVITPDVTESYEKGGILLGNALAAQLGVGMGDSVNIISPKGQVTPFGTVPRSQTYPIAGIFDVEMYEYNRAFIFMPLAQAQTYFLFPDSVQRLELLLTNPNALDPAKQLISEKLGEDYVMSDWKLERGSLLGALETERLVMFVVLSLIILVASFNIISGLMIMVRSKVRDIAILRALGATRGQIRLIFLQTAIRTTLYGMIPGVFFGIVIATYIEEIRQIIQSLYHQDIFDKKVYYLTRLPSEINPMDVLSVVMVTFVLIFIAALYPSWRASQLNPAEALRNE